MKYLGKIENRIRKYLRLYISGAWMDSIYEKINGGRKYCDTLSLIKIWQLLPVNEIQEA